MANVAGLLFSADPPSESGTGSVAPFWVFDVLRVKAGEMERCICSEVATWKSIRGWKVSIHLSLSKNCYRYRYKFKELTSGSEGASSRLCKNTFVVWCSPSHLVRTRRELWFLLSSKSIIPITAWFSICKVWISQYHPKATTFGLYSEKRWGF